MKKELLEKQSNPKVKPKTIDNLKNKILKSEGKIIKLNKDIPALKFKLGDLTLDLEEEELRFRRVLYHQSHVGIGSEEEIASKVDRFQELSEARKLHTKEEGLLKQYLKGIVASLHNCIVFNEDPRKIYHAFRFQVKDKKYLLIEQLNPRQKISVKKLVNWLGITNARKFLKVNISLLEKAIEKNKVKNVDGDLVTIEDWKEVRELEYVEPILDIRVVHESEEFTDLREFDEALGEEQVSVLEDMVEVSNFQIRTLLEGGIQKISDFKNKAGEKIANLPGIGKKLAKSIFEKITNPIF